MIQLYFILILIYFNNYCFCGVKAPAARSSCRLIFVTSTDFFGDFGKKVDPFDYADAACMTEVENVRPDLAMTSEFKAWLSTSTVIFH